jgi:hypothetical protein
LLQAQGMISEYEPAKIMECSRGRKRHPARRGSVNVLSGVPYGYRHASKQEGDGEARWGIERMFQQRLSRDAARADGLYSDVERRAAGGTRVG